MHLDYLATGQLEILFFAKLEKIAMVELWRGLNEEINAGSELSNRAWDIVQNLLIKLPEAETLLNKI